MSGFALSDEQREAAMSDQDHVMIIAPPGCGKSEILAHRTMHQISRLEKNQRVLALTFTNRSRSNLEERLLSVLGHERMRRNVVIRNFHGYATQIVLAHGRTIRMAMDSLLLPKTTTVRKALEALNAGNAGYEAERILNEVKRSPLSDKEVLLAIEAGPPGHSRDLALQVESARQEANQLHYGDLLRHAQRLLLIPAISRLYQAHFGAVLVDEFQDLSMQQLDVSRLSCVDRQTYAGDPLQGIFSWAGAVPSEVESELRKVCGEPIRLHESYRSSPRVLEAVNSVSEQVDPEATLVAAKPDQWKEGGCSAALVFQDRGEEAEALSGLARSILAHDPDASIGIICRASWRRGDIDEAFASETGFPVHRWDLAIENPQVVSLIQSTVAALPRGASVEDARLAVLDAVDSADVETREHVDDAFDTLANSGETTARAAVRSIRVSDPKQTIASGVHLLNAHTGKGQQFDWVFVVGLEEGHMPSKRNNQGEKLEEEERVLLVMLSRARNGLIITRARTAEGMYGPYPARASRWWNTLETSCSNLAQVESHLRC